MILLIDFGFGQHPKCFNQDSSNITSQSINGPKTPDIQGDKHDANIH